MKPSTIATVERIKSDALIAADLETLRRALDAGWRGEIEGADEAAAAGEFVRLEAEAMAIAPREGKGDA